VPPPVVRTETAVAALSGHEHIVFRLPARRVPARRQSREERTLSRGALSHRFFREGSPMNIQPVILCGGSGTRLWPLSREQYPKQLLALNGELTLLQATARRVDSFVPAPAAPLVVCNEEHRFLVAEQLREIG